MSKLSRLSSLRKDKSDDPLAPETGPIFSVRFVLALVLVIGGIAWLAYYYVGVRPTDGWIDGLPVKDQEGTGPMAVQELQGWNYLIGFGAIMLGLVVAAHPSTPLGRGRGVVVGMLGCFIIGLLWICVYYVTQTANPPKDIAIFNDLEQKNLFVGIALMAVGFTFATKWE